MAAAKPAEPTVDEPAAHTATVTVTVLDPFRVYHAGQGYYPGDQAQVPEDVANSWCRNGWVNLVDEA